MDKSNNKKVRLVMVGTCPRCGKEHVRKPPVDAAACTCTMPEADAVLVPLKPAIALSNREYAKFQRTAELAGVSVEQLVNELLVEGAKEKLNALQPFPQLTVTTRR
jgi:hypothetical protein